MAINDEDEVVYEAEEGTSKKGSDIVMDEESEAPDAIIKKLKEKVKLLESEKQENMDGWQRERADFVNYKKRIDQEKIDVIKYANESLVEELLPVLDSFEMAFANKEVWEKVDKNWRVGVEYIHTQLLKILDENNFRATNPIGEKFDPKFHIAVEHTVVDDESKDGTITDVKKTGYILNDRVIKPAEVVVAEFQK